MMLRIHSQTGARPKNRVFLMRGDTKTNNNSKTKSPDRKPGVNFLKASCPGGESRRWYENPQGLNGP